MYGSKHEVESRLVYGSVVEEDTHGPQYKEQSEDAFLSSSESASVVPQLEKGTTKGPHQFSSSSTPATQLPTQDAHPPIPPLADPVPIAEINPR